jgi:hypothetical protein
MPTFGPVNPQLNSLMETVRKCIVCGKSLRGIQEKFCSDSHRWKADANARKAIERIGKFLTRREVIQGSLATALAFALHLESRPESSSARREHTASVLHQLDLLLSRKGPNYPEVRYFARVQADAIRLAFEAEPSRHTDDRRHYVRALEILRDTGLEYPYDAERLLHYAWTVVRFYYDEGDFLNLAKSLQALANTYRLNEDERNGKRFTHYAWHILNEQFSGSKDPEVLTIVHQSAFWDLRLTAGYLGRETEEQKCRRIVDLAGRVDTPAIWIETYRELAGHFGRDWKYEDKARTAIEHIDRIRKEQPGLTTYGAPTLLRPEIELRLGSGREEDKDEAIGLIETKYLPLYRRDPHVYYFRQLKKWDRKYGLSLDIPVPSYASPILVYMPRGTLVA